MNGILIYTEEEARRNSFAVEKITGLLEIPLVISERDEIPDNIDFAVNRTDNAEIAKGLESRGVRVFNPYSLSLQMISKNAMNLCKKTVWKLCR